MVIKVPPHSASKPTFTHQKHPTIRPLPNKETGHPSIYLDDLSTTRHEKKTADKERKDSPHMILNDRNPSPPVTSSTSMSGETVLPDLITSP
jgi:hypothetical protein